MAKQWTCARCSTKNDETTLTCITCRMIRGAVVVPTSFDSLPMAPAVESPSVWDVPASELPLSEWARHAGPPTTRRRKVLTAVSIVGLFLVATVVSVAYSLGQTGFADALDPGFESLNTLEVGDCFDTKGASTVWYAGVAARPCSDEHKYEVIWVGTMPDGPYPAAEAFDDFMIAHCFPAFADYIGVDYSESPLDIYWFYPLEKGWIAGDRSIQCAAYDPQQEILTRSVKGTGGRIGT